MVKGIVLGGSNGEADPAQIDDALAAAESGDRALGVIIHQGDRVHVVVVGDINGGITGDGEGICTVYGGKNHAVDLNRAYFHAGPGGYGETDLRIHSIGPAGDPGDRTEVRVVVKGHRTVGG